MADAGSVAHEPTLVSETGGTDGERLVPGAAIGDYLVDRFLGSGAMGDVYAGTHPVIGKRVAIKVLRRALGASVEGAERFKREARAVNQVGHPNVVDVFAFGRIADGRLYLVMDLVEGRSVRQLLSDGPLEIDAALAILDQVAEALDAAHARGVVHRDLKPDNVMVGVASAQGRPRVSVLDFGLAKLLETSEAEPPPSAVLTGRGTWIGTPGYMAPEQWGADGAEPASDRYALGVMAFEMLAGKLPFEAPSLPKLMEQHFRASVPSLAARGAPASSTIAALDPVLARAMAKEPLRRYTSARELVATLRGAAGSSGHDLAPAVRRRRSLVAPALAGAGVLGVAIIAVALTRGSPRAGTSAADGTGVPESASALPAGLVRLEVYSIPAGSEVVREGRLVGRTPMVIDAAPATELVFTIRRPGYAAVRHAMRVPAASTTLPAFQLQAIRGFEGVWALPDGELRAFERAGDDRVAVSKVASADGARQFFRHYAFVPADEGAVFATSESLIDPAAPTEPSCNMPQAVEYRYDPASDALTLRRERIRHDLVQGRCIVRHRELDAPVTLIRADGRATFERESLPPVGTPVPSPRVDLPNKPPTKPTNRSSKPSSDEDPKSKLSPVPQPQQGSAAAPPPQQGSEADDDVNASDAADEKILQQRQRKTGKKPAPKVTPVKPSENVPAPQDDVAPK